MSGLRSGMIVLLLAIPFFGYVGWQVQGVSRADLIVSDPPSDKGLPGKDQLTAAKTKADKWGEDVKKVEGVAFQFRVPGKDEGIADEEYVALAKSVGTRSADLLDLETFLSAVDAPSYVGALKNKYQEWQSRRASLAKAEKEIEKWFTTPLAPIETPDAATTVLSGFAVLVGEYTQDTKFSDPTKAATWKVRARVRVIESLVDAARGPYEKVINLRLPLPTEADSPDVKKALGAPRGIREQVKLLQTELAQAEDAKLTLPGRLLAEAKEMLKRADEWGARERLLDLFAEPKLFTRASGAADWLAKIQAQFDRTSSPDDRARLREKVQEFCEAFLPREVLLDEEVLLDGKPVARSKVEVKYFPQVGGASVRARLTATPDGLNEFNVIQKYPGDTLIVYDASEYYPKQLQPTALSKAAIAFLVARTDRDPAQARRNGPQNRLKS